MMRIRQRLLPLPRVGFVLVISLTILLSMGWNNSAVAARRALVLYDSIGEYSWLSQIYLQLLVNLLSHFDVEGTGKPVEEYTAGDVNSYDTTFYLGILYKDPTTDPLPPALKTDLIATTRIFCWISFNLWQFTDDLAFREKFGIESCELNPALFSEVHYKDTALTRDDPDPIGDVTIADASKVVIVSTCNTADQTAQAPYIIKSANLYYVADNPMSYVTDTDRYLAFTDVLYDILQVRHAQSYRALVRIEDVHPLADPAQLRAIADYLGSERVPFAVCVIPEYHDPFGVYNQGVPLSVKLSEAPDVVAAIHYMKSRGGSIVMHGFTHQYDTIANPYNGVTGEDYEFYRIELDQENNQKYLGPVPEDSATWARDRVLRGLSELTSLHLTSVAWNTPHYLASVVDYGVFGELFAISLDQGTYFATDAQGATQLLNQMAPYVLNKDVYGIKRMPETLGYIDPYDSPPILPATLLHRAALNKVGRDAWASFYFHWFLDVSYLQDVVTGLKNQGYGFVPVRPNPVITPAIHLLLSGDSDP